MKQFVVTGQGLTNAAELLLTHYVRTRDSYIVRHEGVSVSDTIAKTAVEQAAFDGVAGMFLALHEIQGEPGILWSLVERSCGRYEGGGWAAKERFETESMPKLCAALESLLFFDVPLARRLAEVIDDTAKDRWIR